MLIPEEKAKEGLERIRKILKTNPTISYIFSMSLQTNYWLQKLEFYTCQDENFLHNAQPRRIGLEPINNYYQPVNPKALSSIIGNIYDVNGFDSKIVPILPAKDSLLKDKNIDLFQTPYLKIKESLVFNKMIKNWKLQFEIDFDMLSFYDFVALRGGKILQRSYYIRTESNKKSLKSNSMSFKP